MIRTLTTIRNLGRNERGNSLVAYAVLLGGIAVVLAGGLLDFSNGVTTALTNEANDIATIAGASTSAGSPAASPSNPTSPAPTSPTPRSPGGRRGSRR